MATVVSRTDRDRPHTLFAIIGLASPIVVALLAIAALGLLRGPDFALWAFVVAIAAFMGGAFFGLLFGVPGTSAALKAAEPRADGRRYTENTSLEQIADWLTKIIVGATLVQLGPLSVGFGTFSQGLTRDLLCPAASGSCGRAAGGGLVAMFFIAGFLIAYLWMRRFFIFELTIRDDEVDTVKARLQAAAREGRLQMTERPIPDDPDARERRMVEKKDALHRILDSGVAVAPARLKAAAKQVRPGDVFDDPWAGAFGGQAANARALLTAKVTAVPDQTQSFQVNLTVTGLDPEEQRKLAGDVALFYLHPTFGPNVQTATFGLDGRACLTLFAYGAFTVGILFGEGEQLELDLAMLPGAPDTFRAA